MVFRSAPHAALVEQVGVNAITEIQWSATQARYQYLKYLRGDIAKVGLQSTKCRATARDAQLLHSHTQNKLECVDNDCQ